MTFRIGRGEPRNGSGMALWRERVSAAMPFIDTAGGLGCDVILLSEEFPGTSRPYSCNDPYGESLLQL